MNFEHTQDRRMLTDTLNRFVAEQCDMNSRHKGAQSAEGYSTVLWKGLAELGAIGALFPESEGGFGGDGFDITVVFESLGRGLMVEPMLGALVVGRAIMASGNETQKAKLPAFMEGSAVTAFAFDEPDTHHELTHISTQAVRSQGGWVLNGKKAVVVHGEQADLLLVSARTAGKVDDEAGISLFLVPGDAPGINCQGYPRIDGGRAADIVFDNVQVDASALLGGEGQGLETLELAAGWGMLALCAESVGAMEVAKQHTLEYLQTRKQFGVPIGSFQALQHRMADLLVEIEQARSAVINAAATMGADRRTRERALSAAKYSIGRIGTMVSEESIQLHGGIGMSWELPLAHYAKRLVMIDHQLGDEDHHLARYIGLGQA